MLGYVLIGYVMLSNVKAHIWYTIVSVTNQQFGIYFLMLLFLVALNIVQIVISMAVTGFAIATAALSCKALCCQSKTQGALFNQPGLLPFYHMCTIFLYN